MDWQPIETAPKDGTSILVGAMLPWRGWFASMAYWSEIHESWWYLHWIGYEPTHWMPLPPPPEAT